MSAYDSADARTALMATYFSRYPYPQAGTRCITPSSPSAPLRHYDVNAPDRRIRNAGRKGSSSSQKPSDDNNRFPTRGRTIYNAHTVPLAAKSTTARLPRDTSVSQRQFQHDTGMAVQNTTSPALAELQRIDAEEEWKKNHRYQFLIAARGDMGSKDWNAGGNYSPEGGGMSGIWGMPRRRGGSRDSKPSSSPSSASDSEWEPLSPPYGWDAGAMDMDYMGAQEMFDLYIKADECGVGF
ncbi:hypothetical protein PAXRUDRAFT_130317 [Paxillus rubicundulus Ve08.2h10]|uniref:Uncharacterized protein n=1 Tax=Paxillus rubicundulus Ve08.2h10 TaxID=930991 RepID=A0A0D0EAC9_9AGAM|nr:hypothetical protein PAXRUDRAFT_130317 [Paxillus rubicundulus Ve08.2h10]